MRSGLAIEMRIWSKLCGPLTCPKMFINSFIEDPFPVGRHARESGHPELPRHACGPRPPLDAGVTKDKRLILGCCRPSVAALLQLDIEAKRAQLLDEDVERFGDARLEIVVAAHDRLVDLGAAGDIVRLD